MLLNLPAKQHWNKRPKWIIFSVILIWNGSVFEYLSDFRSDFDSTWMFQFRRLIQIKARPWHIDLRWIKSQMDRFNIFYRFELISKKNLLYILNNIKKGWIRPLDNSLIILIRPWGQSPSVNPECIRVCLSPLLN